ncbi:MAG: restriction endonuclease [Sulfurimonas sp.]|jgi:hypothetical protein
MFFNTQNKYQQDEYQKFLKIVGHLSNLFSESTTPYLYYRIAEKIFCKAFEADDLSRSDVSADAKKMNVGIGLKTFLAGNHKTFQKVAEFGGDKSLYENLTTHDKILKIAELRNTRIDFTQRVHALENSIYHCVIRDSGKFMIHEERMHFIDTLNIKNIKTNKGSISFDDGVEEYSFLTSKNTLAKRFLTEKIIYEFPIEILENPLDVLSQCLSNIHSPLISSESVFQTIYLPLYGKDHIVYERSGLNQWNAKGRDRNVNEAYIPIPAPIHKNYPSFFPNRDQPFDLKLPNGKIIKSKICQDGGKALMSYSNRELGQWILRDVLKLKEGELLTYEKLQILGIDSVRIDKINNENYEINFASNGSFKNFINQSL